MHKDSYRPFQLVIVVLLFGYPGLAQDIPHLQEASLSDSLDRRFLGSILVERNLNTYNWMGRMLLDTTLAGVRLAASGLYATNIIQLEGPGMKPRLQSSQQNLSFATGFPVVPGVTPNVRWTSFVYSDNKGTALNNASSYTTAGGVDIQPVAWLTLRPAAGYRWDSQAGIRDRGASIALNGDVAGLETDGFDIAGSGRLSRDFLSPRRLTDDGLRLRIQKQLSPETFDSLTASVTSTRRDLYALANSDIESRGDRVLTFSNFLAYDIAEPLRMLVSVAVTDRTLDKEINPWGSLIPAPQQFNTSIDEFRLETFAQTEYRSPQGAVSAWLRFAYGERSETHAVQKSADLPTGPALAERERQEEIKNNTSRQIILSGGGAFALSRSDRLNVSASAGILRYDTPSSDNVEDRDELLVAVATGSTHRLSQALELTMLLEGTVSHTVYLYKERSANNGINRVLRFSPRTVFRPVRWLTTVNGAEVLANYTVYDFEALLTSVRSYSYRQFGWLDSTVVDVTHRVSLDILAYWRTYVRGELRWAEFLERPERAAVEETYAVQLRCSPWEKTTFAVGFRYFGQAQYSYSSGDRRLDSFLSSAGPTCLIRWDVGPHSRLQCIGWSEHRHLADGSRQSLPNVSLTLSWIQ
jgi:hypothetical protein